MSKRERAVKHWSGTGPRGISTYVFTFIRWVLPVRSLNQTKLPDAGLTCLTEGRDPDESAGWCEKRRDRCRRRRRRRTYSSCCCLSAVLQSFPWSEDSAVAQPQGLHNHGRKHGKRVSQRAMLCTCIDAFKNLIALPSVSRQFMCV